MKKQTTVALCSLLAAAVVACGSPAPSPSTSSSTPGNDSTAPSPGGESAQPGTSPAPGAGDDALVSGMNTGAITGNMRLFLTDAPAAYDAVWVSIPIVEARFNGVGGCAPGAQADAGALQAGDPLCGQDSGSCDPNNATDGSSSSPGAGDAEPEPQMSSDAGSELSNNVEGWVALSTEPVVVDLLTLRNDVTSVLGDSALVPGCYAQIRLHVDRAWVEQHGVETSLKIPSGELKISFDFDIEQGKTYVLVLDYDAEKSVKPTGQGLVMQPVIRVAFLGVVENGTVTPVFAAGSQQDPNAGPDGSEPHSDKDGGVEDNGNEAPGQGDSGAPGQASGSDPSPNSGEGDGGAAPGHSPEHDGGHSGQSPH